MNVTTKNKDRILEAQRRYRQTERGKLVPRVRSKTATLACRWVRENMPHIYQAMLDEAWESVGLERMPVGRPPKED